MVDINGTLKLSAGETLRLTCHPDQNITLLYMWIFTATHSIHPLQISRNQTYVKPFAQASDSGGYTCEANVDKLFATKTVHVEVGDVPSDDLFTFVTDTDDDWCFRPEFCTYG